VSPVKYELGFYIPEDAILHSHCRENLKSYILKSYSFSISELMTSAYFPIHNYRGLTYFLRRWTSNLMFYTRIIPDAEDL
jgi:hypothetical protein